MIGFKEGVKKTIDGCRTGWIGFYGLLARWSTGTNPKRVVSYWTLLCEMDIRHIGPDTKTQRLYEKASSSSSAQHYFSVFRQLRMRRI